MAKATKAAAKKAKVPKAPKAAKVKRGASTAAAPVDRDMQNLARHHRDNYVVLTKAKNKAARALQAFGKVVKGDGLTMRQIKVMVDLQTPEGEAALRASMAGDLQAAQWQGATIGAQLSLFMEPDRTPAADMAFEEGVADAMDNKVANPKYAPSVPQHASYMKGYHEEQSRQLKAGIKKLPDGDKAGGSKLIPKAEKESAVKAKADRAAARSAANAAPAQTSGVGLTRAQYQKQQRDEKAANRAAAEALFDQTATAH